MPLECALYYSDKIEGSNNKGGREKSSAVVEFNHRVHQPVDTQKGTITGSRIHHTVEMLTELDTATPSLYQACCTGQTLAELKVNWYDINDAAKEEVYFTHTLEGVKVVSVEIVLPNTKDPNLAKYKHLVKLNLLYEKITWEYAGGYKFPDAWKEKKK